MENFHDLLAGTDAAQNGLAQGLLFDSYYKILRHLEVDICIQQGESNFAEGVCDIRLTDLALTTEIFENVLKFIGESGKHGASIYVESGRWEGDFCLCQRSAQCANANQALPWRLRHLRR